MRTVLLGNFRVPYTSESHHAASLESLGVEVVRLQEGRCNGRVIAQQACDADLFVWIHTHGWRTPGIRNALAAIKAAGVPTMTYHLDLWRGLKRESDIRSGPYWELDHFFTVDRLMADWLTDNTPVRGHFLPAGVFHAECVLSEADSAYANDVVFVGARKYHPEWPWRPTLIGWLEDTYKDRFTHIGGITSLRGRELNAFYARSKVAVGDTLCQGFDYPWYTSDRLFEAPGRGGFQIFPNIHGIREWFPPDTLPLFKFGDFAGIKDLIDRYLEDDELRETTRLKAHQHVKDHHTYRHRWQTILTELGFEC